MFMSLNTKLEEKRIPHRGKVTITEFFPSDVSETLSLSVTLGTNQTSFLCLVCVHVGADPLSSQDASQQSLVTLSVHGTQKRDPESKWFKNHPLSLRASMPSFSQLVDESVGAG